VIVGLLLALQAAASPMAGGAPPRVTLDQAIPLAAVKGAQKKHLVVI